MNQGNQSINDARMLQFCSVPNRGRRRTDANQADKGHEAHSEHHYHTHSYHPCKIEVWSAISKGAVSMCRQNGAAAIIPASKQAAAPQFAQSVLSIRLAAGEYRQPLAL